MRLKKYIFTFLLITIAFCFFIEPVKALDVGMNEVDNSIDLGKKDPRETVGEIINIAMLFLGVIAVGIIIFAGFKWMTAGGSEEKVSEAKKILKNGVIGLVIVLSSWGIASFILNQLMSATGPGPSSFSGDGGGSGGSLGSGAIGSCSVQSVYPEPGQTEVARNSAILIKFKEELNLETFCLDSNSNGDYCDSGDKINPDNIHIYENNLGDDCETGDCSGNINDVYATVSDDRLSFTLVPANYLGSSSSKTWHTVYMSNAIEKVEEGNIFDGCSSDYLNWSFEVGDFLDLTPPKVVEGGIFPASDNGRDTVTSTSYQAATGGIEVKGLLNTYQAASVDNVIKNPIDGTWDSASAEISENYHEQLDTFQVVVSDNGNQAQLYNNGDLLTQGVFGNNEVIFDNYFTLTVLGSNYGESSSWTVNINPETLADSLKVGSKTYVVSEDEGESSIEFSSNLSQQAQNIYVALSGHSDVEASLNNTIIDLSAKVQGEQGNNIIISSTASGLEITPMTGGVTGQDNVNVNDSSDKPRNSVIQINFNEAINPATISGSAQNIAPYLRVLNASSSAKGAGETCTEDNECLSYNCKENICENDYINGNFVVSNQFKTVEFISDNECGLNGCGEKIYCLPASSNLEVRLTTAGLSECENNDECLAYSPYNNCSASGLGYNVCQDEDGSNYPAASVGAGLTGILDSALNSLDGNRDDVADGPLSYFNVNQDDSLGKDNFVWSFYINDVIEISTPEIISVSPELGDDGVDLDKSVDIEFNKLMMNSTLVSGSAIAKQGDKEVEHQLVNLNGSSPYGLGYWIVTNNLDTPPLNGEADITKATIKHSLFNDALSHVAEVGSGVRDIYQNCYKPSSGPSCVANDLNPTCCFGTAVSEKNCDNY